MSDYPKAGWNGGVIPGGWDSRHARPAGEVAGDDLDDLDALLAEAERRGAEAEREGWISYFEAWAGAVGASEFTAENVLRAMRGAKPWGCARADEIGGAR